MRAAHPIRLAVILAVIWGVLCTVALIPGGFRFQSFETDMTHLAQILMRLHQGGRIFDDISTPLGPWGFWPIELMMGFGMPMGRAIVMGQALAGVMLLPLLWWAAFSRLSPGPGVVLGVAALVIMGGLTYGGTDASVTFAMHYNRWSWGILLPVLVLAMVPGRGGARDWIWDGLAIGAGMVALAMIKASNFAAFAPVVIVGLALARNWRGLGLALVVGVVALLVLTLAHGMGFWQAYIRELLIVSGSPMRVAPGAGLSDLIAGPKYVLVTLLFAAALMLLRRVDPGRAVMLIALVPGAWWAVFQNYGNDPLWLIPLGLMLWQLGAGAEGRRGEAMRGVAVLSGVLVAPVMINFALSVPRHLTVPPGGFTALLADPGHGDLQMPVARVATRLVTRKLDPKAREVAFQGRQLPACELSGGFIAAMRLQLAELKAAGVEITRQPVVADLFATHWILAGWAPLDRAAPWYYDGLPGFEGAGHLIVPDCPVSAKARGHVLRLIEATGRRMDEAFRGSDFTVYRLR